LDVPGSCDGLLTEQEELLWRRLRNRSFLGLKFRRQQPIDGYVADFCCFEKRVIVEVDGAVHLDPKQRLYDEERDEHFHHQDFRVIRVTNDDIEKTSLEP
jgi:very-short-patch-repair endonuclease